MRVDFYFLTRSPVEKVLPRLVGKILSGGGRALVHAGEPILLERLDSVLWTDDPRSFIPHARAGGAADADQPVLLSDGLEPLNGARLLLIADGRWPAEIPAYERVFYLFDAASLNEARQAWRGLGADRHYWKQDENGAWVEGP